MEMQETLKIVMVPLNVDSSIEIEHILIMECIGDTPVRYYLAELPLINTNIRNRLHYYENLVN